MKTSGMATLMIMRKGWRTNRFQSLTAIDQAEASQERIMHHHPSERFQ